MYKPEADSIIKTTVPSLRTLATMRLPLQTVYNSRPATLQKIQHVYRDILHLNSTVEEVWYTLSPHLCQFGDSRPGQGDGCWCGCQFNVNRSCQCLCLHYLSHLIQRLERYYGYQYHSNHTMDYLIRVQHGSVGDVQRGYVEYTCVEYDGSIQTEICH